MATNGQLQGNHINIGGNGGNFFFINWQLAGQSIENNNSVINWQAYFHYNAADAQLDNGIAALSGTRWHNGGRVKNYEGRFVTRDVAVASGSFTIGHNADGTQSVSVSGGIDVYQSGRSQGGTSWALPTIPRNSQVSTNATAYTLGNPITINTNRKSGSFTHTVTIRKDNGSGTLLKTFNTVGASVTWTPSPAEITTMQGLIPNSNTLTLFINQYNNQVQASSNVTRNLTLTDANPTFSNFTFKDTSATAVATTGDDQVLVKGKSILEVKVPAANKMVAVKSATPDRYDIVYEGATEQEAYSTGDVIQSFTPITSTGSRAIIVRAYDSRGNSTAVTKSVTVYDYVEPNIEIGISRENNFGANVTITTAGEFDLLPVAGVNKNSLTASSLKFRYREQPSGTWTTLETIAFTVSGNEFTGTTKFKVLDNTKSYDFEFQIADKFGTVTQTATLGAGVPLFFVGENGTVEFNGKNIIELVYPVGSIYTATVSTNPSTLLGFGTWTAYGAGRVIVGKAASGTFGTAGATGGAETHTLTEAQIPSHRHTLVQFGVAASASGYPDANGFVVGGAGTDKQGGGRWSGYTGGGGSHNNLQPYIVAYMWQRTA